jgi:hypothetical protein
MDGNPVALVDPWGDKAKGPRQNQYKAKGGNGRGAIACPGEKKEPQTNSLNSFINNKIQEEFGKTITLDQFNKLNDGIVDYLKTQDKGSGYTLDSSYDGNTGEYVFDIQEASMKRSVIGASGGDNVRMVLNTTGSVVSTGSDLLSPAGAYVEHVNKVTPPQRMKRVIRSRNPYRIYDNRVANGKATYRMYRAGRALRWLGPITSAYGTIMSVDKIMSGEYDNWDVADATLGAVSTVVGVTAIFVSSPVLVGVSAITGVYFLGRMISDILAPPVLEPKQSEIKLGEPLVLPNDNTTVGNNSMGGY